MGRAAICALLKEDTMRNYTVVIVGASTVVGQELITVLEQRDFPVQELRLVSSEHEPGASRPLHGQEIPLQPLTEETFQNSDLVLLTEDASQSERCIAQARNAGAIVIDNTSVSRTKPDVPLVIPEINPYAVEAHRGILANPTSSTILMAMVLAPLYEEVGIERIVVSTYQAVSETGYAGIEELDTQIRAIFNSRDILCNVYPHQIACNCLPHVGAFSEDGYSQAERALVHETQRIFDDDDLRISPTAVRVPVFYGHSQSLNIETEDKISVQDVRELFEETPGITVLDDPANNRYPLPVDASGEDAVFVGRIREDASLDYGINLWVVTDNIRKGAALNIVHIAERLIEHDAM